MPDQAFARILAAGSASGELIAARDWSGTALGAIDSWPGSLRTMLGTVLRSPVPMLLLWGEAGAMLHNDGFAALAGERHPALLGASVADAWPEIAEALRAGLAGDARSFSNRTMPEGGPDAVAYDLACSPVLDDAGRPAGVLALVTIAGANAGTDHGAEERAREQLLLRQLPGFVAMLSGPEHRYAYVNDAFTRLAGPGPFVGRTSRDAPPMVAEDRFHALLDQVYRDGERFEARAIAVALGGAFGTEERFIDLFLEPVRAPGGDVTGILVGGHDVTASVKAERRREALLTLGDRLRDVTDTAELSFAAAELLGSALGAARVGYGVFDVASDTLSVERNWSAPGFASVAGLHHFSDYGDYADDLRRGVAVANDDVETDPRTAHRAAAFAAIGVRAFLDVPVVEDGKTVAQMFVHASAPRRWTDGEIAFVRDFAERTRVFVQRRRAEAAMVESRGELQLLADTLPVLVAYMDRDCRYRFVNRTYEQWFPEHWRAGMIGRSIREIVGDAAYAKVAAKIDRVLSGEPVQFEQLMPYAEGPSRYIQVDYTPRWSADGDVIGFYSLVQDVSAAQAAKAAVEESETRFRSMADGAPVMMWVTDPAGSCTYLNARWYEFTGQTPGSAEGSGWLDAVHPDDRGSAEGAIIAANAEQRTYRVDFRLRRADGAYRWVIHAAAARFTTAGAYLGYVGSVIDIDERREAEARLAFSEEQLRLATNAAEIALWDLDLVTDTLFWPPRLKAMFGIAADVAVSMADFYAGLHPDDAPATATAFAAAADPLRRAVYDVEYRTIGQQDGVIRWVAAKGRGLFAGDGTCIRAIGTAIDITARKADEVRLRELNDQLEQQVARRTAERNRVWEMSRDLLAIMGFDGLLKVINPAWETTLGRTGEALMAMPFREQVHPDDHARVEALMARLLDGETVERFEDRLRHADGSWRWISWTLVPDRDVFYAVGRDVTDEREAAAELEAVQEALRQSQKMEAMGQLTGGVAHDFNNLLTPIVGALDLLQRRGLGSEREQRLIDGAAQSAERAKTLVQRLLAFARRQPLQPVSVDMGDLVTGMADLVASTTGPQIRVVVDVAEALPAARADPNQLEMAVLNLAVNARDAMPDGGTLRISVDAATVGADHPTALRAGHYLRLSVADTGCGMDATTAARAIEPFFSTKGIGKGTGLGLSMVHGLASQLGGTLTIHSNLGVGTNIELWLPRSDTVAAPADASSAQPTTAAARGIVLLVDDEELVRLSTADMLAELGFTVVEAASAEEALRLLAKDLRPDIVVTDHLMPGMTGTDLALQLRAERPSAKVLIVSGYAENIGVPSDVPRLTKPFRKDDLAASLAALSGA